MTSLEFINKVIKTQEESINENKRVLDNWLKSDEFTAKEKNNVINNLKENIKYGETKLQTFQQIKTELEAWEIVKHLIYKRKMGEKLFIQVMGGSYNEGECWTSGINPYEILKKALEVKDE